MQFNRTFGLMPKASIALITAVFLTACGDSSQQKIEKKAQGTVTPQSESQPPVLTAQINRSPLFDSPQGWGPGFAKATGQGLGVVVGPGADNPNVFAQQFQAKQNEQFKVIARASSVGKPKAMGRFEINWLDPDGKFISASIKPFEVTPAEKTFEYDVSAPVGTGIGVLYVVADGPEDVVRYTEMRLLGKSETVRAN